MKKLITIFSIISLVLLAALVTPSLIKDPGYFYIRFAGYEIEMRVIVAFGLLVLFIFSLWLLIYFIRFPKRTMRNFSTNRSRKSFAKGLLALSEGRWKVAEKLLVTSTKNSPTPELGYMAAARAAVAQHKLEQAFDYLDAAESSTDNPLTVDLTRCELWVKIGEFQKAVQVLNRILKSYPNNPRALHILSQAASGSQQWQLLREIMPKVAKLEVLPVEETNRITRNAILQQLQNAEHENDLQLTWDSLSKEQKSDLQFIQLYAKSGLRLGLHQQIAKLIENSLHKDWSDELLQVWSELDLDTHSKIKTAEKWLKKSPDNALLLRILGELCLKNQLWGKAQEYLNKSLDIDADKQTFKLMARYFDLVGEPDNALEAYRHAETSKPLALPNPEVSDE
ncbi:MAG TPA: heme biosynthesis HemY N-terminal domain-containing protein [Gammaproteobacteria bacterium]|nr:heme biosynthesis HemY N-terminal domain-containing protein [Gammaproteobacteria bacterium]